MQVAFVRGTALNFHAGENEVYFSGIWLSLTLDYVARGRDASQVTVEEDPTTIRVAYFEASRRLY